MHTTATHKTTKENQTSDLVRKPDASKSAYASQQNTFNSSPLDFNQIPLQAKLQINIPGDRYEQEADRIADRVVNMNDVGSIEESGNSKIQRKSISEDISSISGLTTQRKCSQCDEEEVVQRKPLKAQSASTTSSFNTQLNSTKGRGNSMDASTNQYMSSRFGVDFSHVNIHNNSTAAQMSQSINARAFTVGNDIYFNSGEYKPNSNEGKRLLAHELVHTVQQGENNSIMRSVDDWLIRTPNITQWSFTEVKNEIDELEEWLARQIESSEETVRIEESLTELRAEDQRRENRTSNSRSERRRRRRSRNRRRRSGEDTEEVTSSTSMMSEMPRVLQERNSVQYTNPSEIRSEFNLIMEWLAKDDISDSDREILNSERDSLRPLLQEVRQEARVERHSARISTALTGGETNESEILINLATTIQNISPDPNNSELHYIYHNNERIAISSNQANQLSSELSNQLRRFHSRVSSINDNAWERYNSQSALNRDHPIISGISGWLGDVEDPFDELLRGRFELINLLGQFLSHNNSGRFMEAAAMMAIMERKSQKIRAIAMAFVDGYISGAEVAVGRLEFTRDVSFAIAGSIATIVAAPAIAGALVSSGTPTIVTGVLTAGATGTTVGTGTAIVRGGSALAGNLLAGNSWEDASEEMKKEAIRGYREGYMTGIAGGAAFVLGPALGVGVQGVGNQILRRVATESIINSSTTLVENLLNDVPTGEAIQRALASAVVSIPGSALGASSNVWARELGAPLAEGAAAYTNAVRQGATPEEAMRAVGMAVTASLTLNRASRSNNRNRAVTNDNDSTTNPARPRATSDSEIDAEISAMVDNAVENLETSPITGGSSRPRIEGRRIPTRQRRRLDIEDIPRRPNETARQALNRTRQIIGRRISDIPELNEAWNKARAYVLRNTELTASNYSQLYDSTRNRFYQEVRNSPQAQQHFSDAGFEFPNRNTTAPVLEGIDSDISIVESRLSLDHIREKAIGDNWRFALDADNLQMEFAMPNTLREILQARHPELRQEQL